MIDIRDQLDGSCADRAWGLYSAAFAELDTLAVQRHRMYRDEFDQVIGDRRVSKYLRFATDGTLDAVATYTNDLEAVPLISPRYFQRHWPVHYRQRRIWYVGFVAVRDGAPVSVFGEVIAAMHETSGRSAITVLDVCARTEAVRHLPRSVRVLLHRLSGGVRMERLDEQSYWLYEFPEVTHG